MSVKTIGPDGESGKHSMSNLDKKLTTLPDFGSDAHNEYVWAWVKEDFGTEYNLEQGVGNLLNEMGIENDWYDEAPWTNPNSDYFKYLFFSDYVDREQIKELVNSKNAKKTQLENEIREGGLDPLPPFHSSKKISSPNSMAIISKGSDVPYVLKKSSATAPIV